MIHYVEPVFRPPSEARSLILQVTNGCSWNRCTFCEMYSDPQKKFRVKNHQQIEQDLQLVARHGHPVRRIFLADGDAMTLSFTRIKSILETVYKYLPDVQRISSYCLPRNLKNKSVEELAELKQLGLSLLYVGCESGDDTVLKKVSKGENYQSSLQALLKIRDSGMLASVMILNGLGGKKYSEQHAINSAKLVTEAQPRYLSTLVASFHKRGVQRFQEGYNGEFELLKQPELFREMEILLSELKLDSTIFRSDHASNYLVLKGVLNRDRDRLLKTVRTALNKPGAIPLRQESQRGL